MNGTNTKQNKIPTTAWAKFYSGRINPRYEMHIRTRYQYMINRIAREMGAYDVIVESGCGIGSISKQLLKYPAAINKKFLLLDVNSEMLELARTNIAPASNIHYIQHDIRNSLAWYSNRQLIHSHGVLEHFEDEDIRNILDIQEMQSDLIFHYVPSDKYESKSFGDERLLSPRQWRDICGPDRIEVFNEGYDLLLIWDKR